MVLVLEHERDRASDGHAATHAADDSRHVSLDLLAAATTVPALTAREVAAQVLLGNLEPRGHAFHDYRELRTV